MFMYILLLPENDLRHNRARASKTVNLHVTFLSILSHFIGPSHYPESYHATRKTDKNVHNMSVADCFNIFNGSKHTEYPITGAQISLNQSGCTMFNLKESYKAERVEIVFRYGTSIY